MSRRKKEGGHANHERWLISYGDFITLLFALFVVLFASSQVDKRKTVALAQAIQAAFQQLGVFPSGPGRPELQNLRLIANSNPPAAGETQAGMPKGLQGPIYRKGELKGLEAELSHVLAPEIASHDVNLRLTRDGLVVSLQEVGFFDSGSAVMKPAATPVLAAIARILVNTPQNIRVEGHTDNVPIHNARFASNWDLSTARATEVLDLLITRYQLAPNRLSAAGYAKYHPVASNATAAGRARNRRVDIVVLRTDISNAPPIDHSLSANPGGAPPPRAATKPRLPGPHPSLPTN